MGQLFSTVASYAQALVRISWATFAVSLFTSWALVHYVAPLGTLAYSRLTVQVPYLEKEVPLLVFLVALGVTAICRAIKLHDCVSDALEIRANFDVDCILLPLALSAGVSLDPERQSGLRSKRHALMATCFYAYSSSDADRCKIDRHLTCSALEHWSWYWVFVEAIVILLVGATVSLFFGAAEPGAAMLAICVLLWVVLAFMHRASRTYAMDQVRAILEDLDRVESVRRAFRAL